MKLFGYDLSFGRVEETVAEVIPPPSVEEKRHTELAAFGYGEDVFISPWVPIRSQGFNGEKTPGELGNPLNLIPDYRALRARAYQANLDSHIIRIITGKFFKWVVGSGLKLQAEPNEKVLQLEGINEDLEEFRANAEAYFGLFAESKEADYSGMCSLHELASKSFETKFLGGDVLTILRVDDNFNVTVQVIDGQHVVSPLFDDAMIKAADARGNIIRYGIEINKKGQHEAFYVLKDNATALQMEVERIEARGAKTGLLMAWMSYGSKHRIDHYRGVPQITPILETVRKLERYSEASVSSAEERAKLPWYIKHSRFSDGENPMAANIKRVIGGGGTQEQSPYDIAQLTAKNITSTENKTVYNLPIGAELSAINSNGEVQYPSFFDAVFVQLCAAADIPPEVAMQKYSSNYSASRAAINGWGYIIDIYRKKHSGDFYNPVYAFWLYVHIAKKKIKAKGYLEALRNDNRQVVNSYSKARFTGANMPHIDPLKEANAIRKMLGDDITPLMSYEQASEQLNNGEFSENIKKVKQERTTLPPPLPYQLPKVAVPADGGGDKPANKKAKPAKTD